MSFSKRIETLTRRRDYLQKRVTEAEASGKGSSFDKAEASALTWALDVIERVKDQLEKEEEEEEERGRDQVLREHV